MMKFTCGLILAIATLAIGTPSCASETTHSPTHLLFVGDSFTGAQGGIDVHVLKLAQSGAFPGSVSVNHVVHGGATLKRLWELGDAVQAIDTGEYDTVVLQDDIPEINVDYFNQYARTFIDEVRRHHGRPILYMTWAYDRLGWISMAQISEAHRKLSRELDVEVAPVGIAWDRSRKMRPDLDLLANDREHPSTYGMYLAACVVYATIFNRSPEGLGYVPSEISFADARFLQSVAWETVRSW